MLLWHGTRSTDPEKIIHGDEGFDIKYAADSGVWGRGIYFAENASYSNTYRYQHHDGVSGMFLA